MFAITLDVVFTCAKMLHLNSHYHDMDAFVPTNMGLMDLSLKRDFPLFYYLFSSCVFVTVMHSRVIFCLFTLRRDQRRFRPCPQTTS